MPLKYIDLYSQYVKFTNKTSQVFSTKTGKITSILIIILLIVYFVFLIREVDKRKYPEITKAVKNTEEGFRFTIKSDYPSLFNSQADYLPEPDLNSKNTTFNTQWSVGFIDTRNYLYRVIDPKYFWMTVTNYLPNNQEKELFFDYCKRFHKTNINSFQNYNLNKTYCIFSDFSITNERIENRLASEYMSINIHRCKNNTNYILPKSRHPEYSSLFKRFLYGADENQTENSSSNSTDKEDSPSNNNTDTINSQASSRRLEKESNLPPLRLLQGLIFTDVEKTSSNDDVYFPYEDEAFTKINYFSFPKKFAEQANEKYFTFIDAINKNLSEFFPPLNITDELEKLSSLKQNNLNPYLNLNENLLVNANLRALQQNEKELAPVVCASDEQIDDLLLNLQLVLNFDESKFNLTSPDESITKSVKRDLLFTTTSITPIYIYEIEIEALNSYLNYIPTLINTETNESTEYSLAFRNVKKLLEIKTDNSDSHLKIIFKVNTSVTNYIRKYKNILDVFGLVGGLYNILFFIGLILFSKYITYKYNENLINKAYYIVDPEKAEFNLKFENFIEELEKYYNKIDNKGVFSDNEIIKLRKILACPTENEQDIKFKEYLLAYKNEEMEIKKKKNLDCRDLICLDSALLRFFNRDRVAKIVEYKIQEEEKENNLKAAQLKNEEEVIDKHNDKDYVYDEQLGVKTRVQNKNNSINGNNNKVDNKISTNKLNDDEKLKEDNIKQITGNYTVHTTRGVKLEVENIQEQLALKKVINKVNYLKYKVIYDLFRYKLRKGLKLNYIETWTYLTCWFCCTCGTKRKKFKTIDHALKQFHKEKDFSEVLYSVSDFEKLQKFTLDKEQLYLFKSLADEKITWEDAKKAQTEETIEKELNSSTPNAKKKVKIVDEPLEDRPKLNQLKNIESEGNDSDDDDDYKVDKKKKLSVDKFIGRSKYHTKIYGKMKEFNKALSNITNPSLDKNYLNESLLRELNISVDLKNELIEAINAERLYLNVVENNVKIEKSLDENSNEKNNQPHNTADTQNQNDASLNEKEINILNRMFIK